MIPYNVRTHNKQTSLNDYTNSDLTNFLSKPYYEVQDDK